MTKNEKKIVVSDPVEQIEDLFNPVPPLIKKIFPGAKVIATYTEGGKIVRVR